MSTPGTHEDQPDCGCIGLSHSENCPAFGTSRAEYQHYLAARQLDTIAKEVCKHLHWFDIYQAEPDISFREAVLRGSDGAERFRNDPVFHAKVKALSHGIYNALREAAA